MNDRLQRFITEMSGLLDRTDDEATILAKAAPSLGALVATDDWLLPAYTRPNPDRYQQYPLHIDPAGRFSLVSFVWGPGQRTPVHDHRVWGLVGVLRGAELSQRYERDGAGLRSIGEPHRLEAGAVEAVSPSVGDIHQVANAHHDRTSISIHLYGADIGRVERAIYAPDGSERRFISGYADLSEEAA